MAHMYGYYINQVQPGVTLCTSWLQVQSGCCQYGVRRIVLLSLLQDETLSEGAK